MLSTSLLLGKHTIFSAATFCLNGLCYSAFGLAGYVILIYECLDAIPDEVCCLLVHPPFNTSSSIPFSCRLSTYGRRAGQSSKPSTWATATETWCPWRSPICSLSGSGGVQRVRYAFAYTIFMPHDATDRPFVHSSATKSRSRSHLSSFPRLRPSTVSRRRLCVAIPPVHGLGLLDSVLVLLRAWATWGRHVKILAALAAMFFLYAAVSITFITYGVISVGCMSSIKHNTAKTC